MKIRIIDFISFILESYLDIYKGKKRNLYEIVDETNKGVVDQATRLGGLKPKQFYAWIMIWC